MTQKEELATLRRNYAQMSGALAREGERRIFVECLLQEAKDALIAFLNNPAEAARARNVLKQLDEVLLPLARPRGRA